MIGLQYAISNGEDPGHYWILPVAFAFNALREWGGIILMHAKDVIESVEIFILALFFDRYAFF